MREIRGVPLRILVLGLIIVVVILWVIYSVWGYLVWEWPPETTRIYLQAGGVVATSLLIVAYIYLLIGEHRESEKERTRWLYTDVIAFVIDPIRERLAENKSKIEAGEFNWTRVDPHPEFLMVSDGFGAEQEAIERFKERFPEMYAELERHDEDLTKEFVREGEKIKHELREPFKRYLKENYGDEIEQIEIILFKIIRIFLNDGNLMSNPILGGQNQHAQLWVDNRSEFKDIAEGLENVDQESMEQLRQDYIDFCEDLHERLGMARDELRTEYSIPTHHIHQLKESTR